MEQKPKMNTGNECPDSLLKTNPECVSVPQTNPRKNINFLTPFWTHRLEYVPYIHLQILLHVFSFNRVA